MARVWRCGSGPAGVGCGDTYRAVQQAKSNGNAPALHSTREIQRCGRAPKCRYIKCALDDRPAAQQPTPCTRAPRPKGGGAARRRASTRQPLWQRGRAGEGVRRRHLDLRHLPGGTHTMSLITFTHVLSSHSLCAWRHSRAVATTVGKYRDRGVVEVHFLFGGGEAQSFGSA